MLDSIFNTIAVMFYLAFTLLPLALLFALRAAMKGQLEASTQFVIMLCLLLLWLAYAGMCTFILLGITGWPPFW